jgi:secondary thiamine-phosphate synthase enzyme
MHRFSVETQRHTQFVNIDAVVKQVIREAGLENGVLQLHVPHTTAGITINENADPDVLHDLELALEQMAPWNQPGFRHGEGNSAAHVKASLMGSGLSLIVENGQMQLGTWQSIYFCEFDGPRHRSIWALALPTKNHL